MPKIESATYTWGPGFKLRVMKTGDAALIFPKWRGGMIETDDGDAALMISMEFDDLYEAIKAARQFAGRPL